MAKAQFIDEELLAKAIKPAGPMRLAEAFCELNYEQQAEFFACVEEEMREWGTEKFLFQTHWIGRELRDRAASDRTMGREFVSELHEAMIEPKGGAS